MHRRIYILVLSIAASVIMVMGCNGPESSSADAGMETGDARDDVSLDTNPDSRALDGCGNGSIDHAEACDGDDLAGRTCAGFGFDGGELSCMQNCAGFLVEGCHGVPSWTAVEPSPCQACEADEVCVDRQCFAGCEGQALGESSVLDTDVRTHQIRADVTIGGAPVSDWLRFSEWSELFFVSSHGAITKAWASEDDTFEVELFEGTYDIYWGGRLSDDSLPLPVASDVHIDASRQFDFDVNAPQKMSFSVTAPDWFSPFELDIEARVAGAPDELPHVEIGRHAKLDQQEFSVWAAAPIAVTVGQVQGSPGNLEPIGPRFFELGTYVTDTLTAPLELPLRRVEVVAEDLGPAPVEPSAIVAFRSMDPLADQRGDNHSVGPVAPGETRTVVAFEGSYQVRWRWSREVGAGSGSRQVDIADEPSVEIPSAAHYAMRTIDLSQVDLGGATHLSLTVHHPEAGRLGLGRFAALDELEVGMPQGESAIRLDSYRDDELLASWIAASAPFDAQPEFEALREVTVHGEVLVDGRTMPDSPYESQIFDESSGRWKRVPSLRGRLSFECIRDCVGWSTQHLSGDGPADYEFSLQPGVYRVLFHPDREPLSGNPFAPKIVTQSVYVLDPHLEVTGEVRRDFDTRRVNLAVTITEDGGILSELGDWSESRLASNTRGSVELAYRPYHAYSNDPVPPYSVDIGSWGPAVATFTATPGHYELTTELAAIGRLSQGLSLGDDTQVEVDTSLIHRSGQLTWNGQPWQERPASSGALVIKSAPTSAPLTEPSADGSFTLSEWARPMDLVWQRIDEQTGTVDGEFVVFRGCNPAAGADPQ